MNGCMCVGGVCMDDQLHLVMRMRIMPETKSNIAQRRKGKTRQQYDDDDDD